MPGDAGAGALPGRGGGRTVRTYWHEGEMIKMPLTGKAQERCTWPTRATEVGALSVPAARVGGRAPVFGLQCVIPRGVREVTCSPRGAAVGPGAGHRRPPAPRAPADPRAGRGGRRPCGPSVCSQAVVGGGRRDNAAFNVSLPPQDD